MVTYVGSQDNIEDLVTALIKLEHAAGEAYDSAIERLDDVSLSSQVAELRQDHSRHMQDLSQIALALDVDIPDGSAKEMLTQGKVVLADIMGDESILRAMGSNEEDTVTAYEKALQNNCCTAELKTICDQAHKDELRHRTWFKQMAEKLDKAA
jgi:rubrerythrin